MQRPPPSIWQSKLELFFVALERHGQRYEHFEGLTVNPGKCGDDPEATLRIGSIAQFLINCSCHRAISTNASNHLSDALNDCRIDVAALVLTLENQAIR